VAGAVNSGGDVACVIVDVVDAIVVVSVGVSVGMAGDAVCIGDCVAVVAVGVYDVGVIVDVGGVAGIMLYHY